MKSSIKWGLLLIVWLLFTTVTKSQDSIAHFSFYQITSAWYLNATDTVDINDKFKDDYFFAFFMEDISGNQFFTIKNYSGDNTVCIGSIKYDFSESDSIYNVDFYSSDVYCNPDQETPAETIMLEYIPGSEEETGYKFYYLWVILNPDEAMLFLCFDATNIEEETTDDEATPEET